MKWSVSGLLVCLLFMAVSGAHAETPDTVFLEELTWTEIRDRIRAWRESRTQEALRDKDLTA